MRTRRTTIGAVVALQVLTGCTAERSETAAGAADRDANQKAVAPEAAGTAPEAVGPQGDPRGETSEAQSKTSIEADVLVSGFAFIPGDLTVQQDQNVTWVNEDAVSHPLVFTDERTAALPGGTSTTIVFDEAGVFTYRCAIHTSMTGTVTVLAVDGSQPSEAGEPTPDERTDGDSSGTYGGY